MEPGTYYNVEFEDSWLDVEDFVTLKADSKEEAEENFRQSDRNTETVTVTSVERAFRIPNL